MTTIGCISDTHTNHALYLDFKGIDILIHSGDCSNDGSEKEIKDFLSWLAQVPVKHKIFVPGNHDKHLETSSSFREEMMEFCKQNNINLLINQAVVIENISFYGSPDIFFNGYRWFAFGKMRSQIKESWQKIPLNTQVLITHTPPLGILDTSWEENLGDEDLTEMLPYFTQLKAHVFGHIHHSSGHLVRKGINFINGAMYSEGKMNPIRIFKI